MKPSLVQEGPFVTVVFLKTDLKRLEYKKYTISKWKMTTLPFADAACLPAASTNVQ